MRRGSRWHEAIRRSFLRLALLFYFFVLIIHGGRSDISHLSCQVRARHVIPKVGEHIGTVFILGVVVL